MCSTLAALDPLGFSVGFVSLSWFVPITASGTRISPLHGLAVRRGFQGPWRGHARIGLGRSKWHFSGFNGTETPTGYVPLRPHTAPLTPIYITTNIKTEVCLVFKTFRPIPVAAGSKVWIYSRLLAGLQVRTQPGAWMSLVSVVCCQVEVSATGRSLVQESYGLWCVRL